MSEDAKGPKEWGPDANFLRNETVEDLFAEENTFYNRLRRCCCGNEFGMDDAPKRPFRNVTINRPSR